jgi:hypothetical protein
MLRWRLYRATFVPVVLALAIAAFSLSGGPAGYSSTLAPDAFEGGRAFAELKSLAAAFPDRRPGSAGDDALAARVAHVLEGLGGTAGGGFMVHARSFPAQTIDGKRTLATVIAQRPGSTGSTPIVILAHRDAAARGSQAELSATAALLELARAFAASETKRTIVLVSTSGGSGGDAGALDFVAHRMGAHPPTGWVRGTTGENDGHGPFDATIVLGDLAGVDDRGPLVQPFSDGFGSAPLRLERTVTGAITQEAGFDPGAPSLIGQLAHLAFPFAVGEQGVLNAGGLPALLVQPGGERGPSPDEPVSAGRLEIFGRAVLSAVDALDAAPDVSFPMQTGVPVEHQTIPAWVVRLLVGTLLLGPLVLLVDALGRLLRRREPVGRSTLWTLSCAFPFFLAALFACLLGWTNAFGAAPSVPLPPGSMPFDSSAANAVVASALVFGLAWLVRPALMRRIGVEGRPDTDAAGLSILLVLLALSLVVWALNPFTALLLVPALYLWLALLSPDLRSRPGAAIALVLIGAAPFVLLVSFYAHQLGLGPGQMAQSAVLLLAGGHVGVAAAALWSLAFGCAVAVAVFALRAPAAAPVRLPDGSAEITIRGPISYAGPGSLGGTKSALRR